MSIAHRALFTARSLTSFTVRRALIPATRITQTPYLPLTSQSIRKMSDLTTVLAKDAAPRK